MTEHVNIRKINHLTNGVSTSLYRWNALIAIQIDKYETGKLLQYSFSTNIVLALQNGTHSKLVRPF